MTTANDENTFWHWPYPSIDWPLPTTVQWPPSVQEHIDHQTTSVCQIGFDGQSPISCDLPPLNIRYCSRWMALEFTRQDALLYWYEFVLEYTWHRELVSFPIIALLVMMQSDAAAKSPYLGLKVNQAIAGTFAWQLSTFCLLNQYIQLEDQED